MREAFAAACALLIMSIVPTSLSAKGDIVKITIKGATLETPIEVTDLTDPKVGNFPVWSGPGVFVNGVEETDGFIIEWSKAVVPKLTAGLEHYEVSFYAGNRADLKL